MPPIVGIDLGTTNSLIGIMDAGFPILLPSEDGSRLTPSVVYFPETGPPLAGAAAARMRAIDPHSTVYSAKRFMGRRTGEETAEVSYLLGGERGGPVKILAGGAEHSPEAVAACILRKLKDDAHRALGHSIERAVITVPAYFNDAQRNATKTAGELAGLTVERLVNEPTAAALAYGLDKLGDHSKVAVYDLGGGTFDISILELNGGVFQVLATNGNTKLGGDDVDAQIISWLANKIAAGETLGALQQARLREQAIRAKHTLSEVLSVDLEFPFIEGERSTRVTLSRDEIERLAKPIVEKTRTHCLRALADARLHPEDLNEIILVGGQTRMPLVRRFVAEIFRKEPNISQNPDEAVAIGATIQAGILSGAVQSVVLLDVTPLSLGIETFGGLMNVIVPRNSSIPCKSGEMFTNAVAGQETMRIKVLQGEREMARDNWTLGQFDIDFVPSPKGKARVGVQFEIDVNGLLHVLARDTATGAEKTVQIESAIDVSDEAVEKMLEESLEYAFDDVGERAFTEAKLKASEMLSSVRRALEKVGSRLASEERDNVLRCMAGVETSLETNAAQPVKNACRTLDEASEHLAVLLIEQARSEMFDKRAENSTT